MAECFPVSAGVILNVELARKLVGNRRPGARLYVPHAVAIVRRAEVGCNTRRARSGRARDGRGPLTDEPVLLMLVGGVRVLVDGWHRMWHAHYNGRKYLPAHVLTAADVRKCVHSSRRWRMHRKKLRN